LDGFALFVTAEPLRAGGVVAFVVAVFALLPRGTVHPRDLSSQAPLDLWLVPAWNLFVGLPCSSRR
jgi:hypothetical protein